MKQYTSIEQTAKLIELGFEKMKRSWYVGHVSTLNVSADELVDALYTMIIKLKEEGVI